MKSDDYIEGFNLGVEVALAKVVITLCSPFVNDTISEQDQLIIVNYANNVIRELPEIKYKLEKIWK